VGISTRHCVYLICMFSEFYASFHNISAQLKLVVRAMYSNPPIHGARIVAKVLGNPVLKAQWYEECKGMADR